MQSTEGQMVIVSEMKLSARANQQTAGKRSHIVLIANARVKLATTVLDSTGVVVPKEIDLAQLVRMRPVQLLGALFRRPSPSTMICPRCSHRL
jgi:hypothetical protein